MEIVKDINIFWSPIKYFIETGSIKKHLIDSIYQWSILEDTCISVVTGFEQFSLAWPVIFPC